KGTTGVKLVLAPAGRIQGAVALPNPALASLVRVELQTEHGNAFTSTSLAADGAFTFPHVPAGRWTIVAAAPDATPEPGAGIEVPEGGASADPRLAAVPVRTALAAAPLRVVDASGAPVAEARVEVVLSPNASLGAVTDASGVANVVAPPQGEVPVVIEAA